MRPLCNLDSDPDDVIAQKSSTLHQVFHPGTSNDNKTLCTRVRGHFLILIFSPFTEGTDRAIENRSFRYSRMWLTKFHAAIRVGILKELLGNTLLPRLKGNECLPGTGIPDDPAGKWTLIWPLRHSHLFYKKQWILLML